MKKVWVLLSALALALLPGCVSGGGGSGSASSGGGGGGAPTPPPVNADGVFGVGSKNATVQLGIGGPLGIYKISDALRLIVVASNQAGTNDRRVDVNAGDFNDNGPDFLTAVKNSTGIYDNDPTLSYEARDTVMLGGKKLGLSYADFGMWDAHEDVYVTATQSPNGVKDIYIPFYMGDSNKTSHFEGSGTQTFSGTTVAVASGGGQPGVDKLTGTVNMIVDLANLANSNLNINLTNFAEISYPVGISRSGAIEETGGPSLVSVSVNNTRDLSDGLGVSNIEGQFYGNSPNAPSEAVGFYYIQEYGVDPTIVNGSFGVKKQP